MRPAPPRLAASLAAALCLAAAEARAGQATLYLSCTSVAIRPPAAGAPQPGLSFSAFSNGLINDEVAFTNQETNTSHSAFGYLSLPGSHPPILLVLGVNVPGLGDTDLNALTDAFDVRFGFTNAFTSGTLAYPAAGAATNAEDGVLEMTWSRRPGVTTGVVATHLGMPGLKLDLRVTNSFEIFQYKGSLAYTPTPVGDDAYAALSRVAAPGSLHGPLSIGRISAYDLTFGGGAWTNESGVKLVFLGTTGTVGTGVDLLRGALPGYYYTEMAFLNGRPELPGAGAYQVWNFDLFDATDANRNGVPDIADAALPTTPATLTVRASPDGTVVTATGAPGTAAVVEWSATPAGPWSAGRTVALSRSPTVLTNAGPSPGPGFFRLR